MLNFSNLVTRLDEELVQEIVGKDVIATLNNIDPKFAQLNNIREALLKVYTPYMLIKNDNVFNVFVDILKADEANELADRLGLQNYSNVYEKLKSININGKNNEPTILNFFGIEKPSIPEKVEPIYVYNTECNYPLFPHQRLAIKELQSKLYLNSKRVMLHMPTGSGKTRTAMNAICNHLRSKEPTVVVWFANSEELCQQSFDEFLRAWSFLGDREINAIKYWGNSTAEFSTLNDGFIVAGLQKTDRLLRRSIEPIAELMNKTSLVIMDEAHMSIAPTYKDLLDIITGGEASLLGLSATPGRTWSNIDEDEKLSEFYNRQKVSLKVEGYNNPVEYLIDNGYLAKVNNSSLLYSSGLQLTSRDLKYLEEKLTLPDEVFKKLSTDQKRNILIIQKVEELILRHKRIILFAINVEHSNLLATILQAKGVNAFSITSQTDSQQRRQLIDRFKSDEDDPIVLCNYGILTTGFDAPRTSCAVIARPTKSLVLYSQMVGRAIRGINAGGNLEAEIVTVVDTELPGFQDVAASFFNWEDVWEE
jgi:DNA repair protein RadD